MAIYTPNSKIRLLNVTWDSSNRYSVDWLNLSAQTTWMTSKSVQVESRGSFVTGDNYVILNGNINSFYQYNYMMYQNTHYNNKWFYAFITKLEFVNENATKFYLDQDVWQTWQFDIHVRQCYIEREHTLRDEIGQHVVPEGMPQGDLNYTYINALSKIYAKTDFYYALIVTKGISGEGASLSIGGYNYGGMVYPYILLGYETITDYVNSMNYYATKGLTDAIIGGTIIPKEWTAGLTTLTSGTITINNVISCPTPKNFGLNIPAANFKTDFEGYTPQNNKLYSYPYTSLYFYSSSGDSSTLKFENFKNLGTPSNTITMLTNVDAKPSALLIPNDYQGRDAYRSVSDIAIELNIDTDIGTTGNSYQNYLAQTAITRPLRYMNASVGIATGISGFMNPVPFKEPKPEHIQNVINNNQAVSFGGNMFSGMMEFAQIANEEYQASLLPPKANVKYDSTIAFKNAMIGYRTYLAQIRGFMAKIIDEQFSLTGYRVSRVDYPQWKSRPSWNYIKTENALIDGNCPKDHINRMQASLDSGMTFFHNPDYVGDYTLNNKPS